MQSQESVYVNMGTDGMEIIVRSFMSVLEEEFTMKLLNNVFAGRVIFGMDSLV